MKKLLIILSMLFPATVFANALTDLRSKSLSCDLVELKIVEDGQVTDHYKPDETVRVTSTEQDYELTSDDYQFCMQPLSMNGFGCMPLNKKTLTKSGQTLALRYRDYLDYRLDVDFKTGKGTQSAKGQWGGGGISKVTHYQHNITYKNCTLGEKNLAGVSMGIPGDDILNAALVILPKTDPQHYSIEAQISCMSRVEGSRCQLQRGHLVQEIENPDTLINQFLRHKPAVGSAYDVESDVAIGCYTSTSTPPQTDCWTRVTHIR